MSGRWTLDKGVNDLRPFPRCGRFVTVAVPLAHGADRRLALPGRHTGAHGRSVVLAGSARRVPGDLVGGGVARR